MKSENLEHLEQLGDLDSHLSESEKNQQPLGFDVTKFSLSHLRNSEIHRGLFALVRSERKLTHVILLHIQEIESRRIYLDLGYASAYEYLTKELGYSESCAYRRLQSARLLKKVPEIRESLENGSLKLTQLSQVQTALKLQSRSAKNLCIGSSPVTSFEQQALEKHSVAMRSPPEPREILSKLENKTQKETELIIAREFDLPLNSKETTRPQKDGSVRLEITFSKEDYEQLRQTKNQMAHINPTLTWNEFFVRLAARTDLNRRTTPQALKITKTITPRLRRNLMQRAENRCEFVHPRTKERCGAEAFLQVDHRWPKIFGGSNDLGNLRVLCQSHNLAEARRWGLHRNLETN